MLTIRPETPHDHEVVQRLIESAFAQTTWGHQGEADLVERLRANCTEILSLVAVDAGSVIGHVLFSPVTLHRKDQEIVGMGLAPLAVAPAHQRSGVGATLVDSGLHYLATQGCPYVVVLGVPAYYPRFGFELASQRGVRHAFEMIPQDVFFLKLFDAKQHSVVRNGTVVYRPEFGPQSLPAAPE